MEKKIRNFNNFDKINETKMDDLYENINQINELLNLDPAEPGSFMLIVENNRYCIGTRRNKGAYKQFSSFLSYGEINIFIEAMIKTIDFVQNYGTIK